MFDLRRASEGGGEGRHVSMPAPILLSLHHALFALVRDLVGVYLPQCQDPLLSMEIGERTLCFAELRLAVLTYVYMYWSPCQAGALAKEAILEGLEEQMKTERPLTQGACALMDDDGDGEFDRLWLEMGLSSELELFQLVKAFANDNYDWMSGI